MPLASTLRSFGFFPGMADDSYATIGLEMDLQLLPQALQIPLWWKMRISLPTFQHFSVRWPAEQLINVNTLTGASWYVLNTAANALPMRTDAG